ncbi:MAG TPA: Imm6 family immunity protein [Polyangiaceae bacterium]
MSIDTAIDRLVEEATVRARVAFVLAIAERVAPLLPKDLRDRADAALVDSWRWVGGEPLAAEDLYERLTRLAEWEFKAAKGPEKEAVMALESAIFYVCWQAFGAELASGKPIEKGVPNDMAEGSEQVANEVADFVVKTGVDVGFAEDLGERLGRRFPCSSADELGPPITRRELVGE